MFQTKLFTKTRKDSPKDEVSKNADLLIRAGYIHKDMSGVYSFLPLGVMVLNKICNIIREEMNSLGAQELHMTALQDRALWEKTNRWSDAVVDNWFKTKLRNETEVGLAFTHEEPITEIMKDHIRSFRDLPVLLYQIQTKFRNEARAKSGVMRGREFLMKDLYSFSKDEKEHQDIYDKVMVAYKNIFNRVGIGEKTFVTFASGGTFSKYSHEFQTVTSSGEDVIYIEKEKRIAINKEVLNDEVLKDLGIKKENLIEEKSVEVGNIFTLGHKFSLPIELMYTDEGGSNVPVYMGSYGIGPGRLLGVLVELLSDEKGIVWPKSVSPFDYHILPIIDKDGRDGNVYKQSLALYEKLTKKGHSVLLDDRELRAGEKFADSDLIGVPVKYIISEKTLQNNQIEKKDRTSGIVEMISIDSL